LSPFLLKHNRETQNSVPTHLNNCTLLTGTIPNMLVKRFVGGGDDWCIHMDVMVMVFQRCPLVPTGKPISVQCNNQPTTGAAKVGGGGGGNGNSNGSRDNGNNGGSGGGKDNGGDSTAAAAAAAGATKTTAVTAMAGGITTIS
jgi:hypothetical protein